MLMCLVKKNFATTIVEKGLSRSRDLQEISIVRKKEDFLDFIILQCVIWHIIIFLPHLCMITCRSINCRDGSK